jgi:hypothetical protein
LVVLNVFSHLVLEDAGILNHEANIRCEGKPVMSSLNISTVQKPEPDLYTFREPRNRFIGIYSARARIFKPLRIPGIHSKESIPPAYVAWRADTITLFLLGS